MQNKSGTWTSSNITLFVNAISSGAVFLGLLAVLSSILGREAGFHLGSFLPAADAGVAFVFLGISLWILAQWPREKWKRNFAQLGALTVVLWAATTLIHLIALTGSALKHRLLAVGPPCRRRNHHDYVGDLRQRFYYAGPGIDDCALEERCLPHAHKSFVFLLRLVRFCLRHGRPLVARSFLQ